MSGPIPRRRLTLDLSKVAKKARRRPAVKQEDLDRANAGADLINAILGHGGTDLEVAGLIEIPDEAFSAAHRILQQQEGNAAETVALRAAAERIDEDAFDDVARHLMQLPADPDGAEAIAGEFI